MPEKNLILIVEDMFLIATTLEDALCDAGYEVILAHDGTRATSLLWSEHKRLRGLVADIRIPGGVDGWEVARRARDMSPGLPVLYLTAQMPPDLEANGVPDSVLLTIPVASKDVVAAFQAINTPKDTLGS